jgi:glutamate racemase
MNNKKPIGIFDSGYGGLTILADIKKELPQYDYLYLGDNARAPYGNRSYDVVYQYTLEAVSELFARGCELIIIACNTASAKALRTIQQQDLPRIAPEKRVLGVIRPTTEGIDKITESGHIGILATQGTVNSDSYLIELAKFAPGVKAVQHACMMWVPLIEANLHTTKAGRMFIQEDINQLLTKDPKIDTIVLACTHYPILEDYIKSIVPSTIKILSQGPIVAQKLKSYLIHHPEIEQKCSKQQRIEFITSENTTVFDEKVQLLIGWDIDSQHIQL